MAVTTYPIAWPALRKLADDQAGLLTRAQCRRAGATDQFLAWRVASRRWQTMGRGVYLTTPGRDDWLVRAMSALLAVGTDDPVTVAAFRLDAAAHLWGLASQSPELIDLAVPHGRRIVAPPGTRVREVTRWGDLIDDRAQPWRTTLEATVLDLAHHREADAAVALVADAVRQELTSAALLLRELARRRRQRHARLLAEALADVALGAQSVAEVRYIRDVERAHGLPAGERQKATDRGRRRYHDNGYDEVKVIVEVDGRLAHERWRSRVGDGRRDRQVALDGWLTTRVFWVDVAVAPCETAVDLEAIFRSRGWAGSARPCRRRGCTVGRAGAPGPAPRHGSSVVDSPIPTRG